ncbi:uncharacterized protein ARMOST_15037 [Armillaria ostoyae]|uniref:Uncharacterized protein n=1 Tax=Armillaria ostoyae TaxID=47428 RepID=A0A284RS93_ARMOS|nr:uncharacterized protein ARMOST_15037 [Armillaria ostoyae]
MEISGPRINSCSGPHPILIHHEGTISQDMRLRTAVNRGVEIQLIKNMTIAPLLRVQNNFNDANAADDATKWTRLVESALLGITDLEAQTASSIATRGEWYKAV